MVKDTGTCFNNNNNNNNNNIHQKVVWKMTVTSYILIEQF
jgi:hypothetical protein